MFIPCLGEIVTFRGKDKSKTLSSICLSPLDDTAKIENVSYTRIGVLCLFEGAKVGFMLSKNNVESELCAL